VGGRRWDGRREEGGIVGGEGGMVEGKKAGLWG